MTIHSMYQSFDRTSDVIMHVGVNKKKTFRTSGLIQFKLARFQRVLYIAGHSQGNNLYNIKC